ncbi:hypothetical protein ANTPLA_LOCUS3752 [Anthophora plagiata]
MIHHSGSRITVPQTIMLKKVPANSKQVPRQPYSSMKNVVMGAYTNVPIPVPQAPRPTASRSPKLNDTPSAIIEMTNEANTTTQPHPPSGTLGLPFLSLPIDSSSKELSESMESRVSSSL